MELDEITKHALHCCSTHGCFFGDDNCPVSNYVVNMKSECLVCHENNKRNSLNIIQTKQLKNILKKYKDKCNKIEIELLKRGE